MMRLLNFAATSSLAALVLTLGPEQPRADHDSWGAPSRGWANPRQNNRDSQSFWWQRQPAPAPQQPGAPNWGLNGWFQPQAQLPRSQNIEPEAAPAKAPVIYTYRADPLVDLADASLSRPGGALHWSSAGRDSQAVFQALQSGTSGVRVSEQQRNAIVAFYVERDFKPVWVNTGGNTARADDLLAELADADAHGLVSLDYLPADLGGFSEDLGVSIGDRERLARLDLALTAAALRYAMQASGGRLVPDRISAYHDLTPPTVEAREALTRLAGEPSPSAYLASLHPVHPAYEALRRELADLTSRSEPDEAPIAEGPAVKPGQTDARLPAIRSRLAKLGHLSLPAASNQEAAVPPAIDAGVPLFGSADEAVVVEVAMSDSGDDGVVAAQELDAALRGSDPSQATSYDEETVAAVKAFQTSIGLTVDGIIGNQTIAAFNSGSTEERLQRVLYSMERLRWMPRDFGAKHVFVNIASFQAKAVEDGATIWNSKVIVGTPENQTATFSDQMETVVFNPYWGVPASIIINEFLPEIRRDPSWLEREGYEVTDLNGQVIGSYGVDWYNLDYKNLPFGVRQPPGPKNALGEIKFLFPNKHSIYMHDTPSKPLFAKAMRAYSHGCVRVEDPWGFAEIILGWDQQRIASTRSTTRDYSVPVEEEIKVHLSYFTAWPDETGAIRYHEDVYGRDRLVERALGTLTLASR